METRILGTSNIRVSALGLGCMGMNDFPSIRYKNEARNIILKALDFGITLFDTSDAYGPFASEEFLGLALRGRRHEAVIATKFGIQVDLKTKRSIGVCGRPEYVRQSCEASLKRLGIEEIDLYYYHRVDPNVPIEETVGAMGDLVKQGKVRFLGISEASLPALSSLIYRAHRTHPIAAVQVEYALWMRDCEREVLTACRELGIALAAYSPLGRGFLTGFLKRREDIAPWDNRRCLPRFQSGRFERNYEIVRRIEVLARKRNITAAQLSLAWLLHQGKDIIPIFGTKNLEHLEENVKAVSIQLTPADLYVLGQAIMKSVS